MPPRIMLVAFWGNCLNHTALAYVLVLQLLTGRMHRQVISESAGNTDCLHFAVDTSNIIYSPALKTVMFVAAFFAATSSPLFGFGSLMQYLLACLPPATAAVANCSCRGFGLDVVLSTAAEACWKCLVVW